MIDTAVRFVHEPLLVGVIAPLGTDLSHVAVPASTGLSAREIRSDGLFLMSSKPLERLQRRSGWYWSPIDRTASVVSVEDARDRALAAGCARTAHGWTLFTDALGAQVLHYVVREGAVWFSNSARALIAVVEASTGDDLAAEGPDVAGWHSILLLGFPAPGRSAYRSIETFRPGGSITVSAGSTLRQTAAEYPGVASQPRSLADLADALASTLPKRWERLELPLSGGWDSRLLAMVVARQRRRSVRSWTSATDDGIEHDLELAPEVAEALGIGHERFQGEESPWADLALAVARRSDHQTWHHTWLIPLVQHLHEVGRGPVVDGFAGDFLLRGPFQTAAREQLAGVDARRSLWLDMGGNRAEVERVWSPEARRAFSTLAFESFDAATAQFEPHPDWQVLTVLTTRAIRCIGVSPFRLFGPELEVRLPFLGNAVRETILSPGIRERRGPELYRELLEFVNPAVAKLPSTNDADLVKRRAGPRRQTSPSALRAMAVSIAGNDDAMRLLAPPLRSSVADVDIDALANATRYVLPLRTLQAVFGYTLWCRDHPQSRFGIWDGV